MRRLIAPIVGALVFASVAAGPAAAKVVGNPNGNAGPHAVVMVCHRPAASDEAPRLLRIPLQSLQAHLDHGDGVWVEQECDPDAD